MTGVVDDCRPDEVLVVDEEEVEVVEVPAVELVVLPGIVWALTAPNRPTPMRALTAAPVVRRLSRRIAASRARTLSWVVSLGSMRVSVALASKRQMGASCETTVRPKWFWFTS
jgi:hypothetical protein